MPEPNQPDPVATLRSYLVSKKLRFRELESDHAFEVKRPGEFKAQCYYQVFPQRNQFLFYIIPAIRSLQETMMPVAEYFTWINSGMRIGNFELDMRDGTIRCKSSFDFSGLPLRQELIENAAQRAIEAYDRYIKGAANVIVGAETPLEALHTIDLIP